MVNWAVVRLTTIYLSQSRTFTLCVGMQPSQGSLRLEQRAPSHFATTFEAVLADPIICILVDKWNNHRNSVQQAVKNNVKTKNYHVLGV